MKKNIFSMTAALMLTLVFTSCSNDSNDGGIKLEEQTYKTWSKVVFAYGTMYDANETITVSQEQVTFHSDTWGDGTFTVSDLTQNSDGSYQIAATGTITMEGHSGKKDYEATVSGTINQSSQSFIINIPSVMGGTVLNITVGQIPTAAVVEGTYTGGTYASSKYFQHYQPTKDEKVIIKANDDLSAASLSYTSTTWGEFTFEAITIEKKEDGSYSLVGEGKTLMPSMQGGTAEYTATLEGTVTGKTLVATFAVPGVMGGTTIYFNAADFDEVYGAANESL
ncbi:calycin-like domain-containing protein [Xylanibacter ruminicola]|uniref:Calycin-like beta-barrel domain-containing protein n=1 Tax=Xylanibacter ruminicola TaxID=839 RepID=A0A1M6XZ07_XYLRU|nr:calycin-like domain-containing protein [Xylanibacter ruminicola]SHL11230.1 Calycin-like beta-barrel domain-containing protein [Xylanibacter ruminicola]